MVLEEIVELGIGKVDEVEAKKVHMLVNWPR